MNKEELEQFIYEVENIDLSTEKGQNELMQIIKTRNLIGGAFRLNLNPHQDLFFIRARILDNKDDYFKTIDDYNYNKNYSYYIKRGRANFPEQPIFYAARTRLTSLLEVNIIENKKELDVVAYGLSRWVINKPITLIAILNPDTIGKIDCWELDEFLEFVSDTYNELIGTIHEGTVGFYKYLSEKFTEIIVAGEEYKYHFTSIFANQIYEKLPEVSGILYQSVKSPETYNIALKSNFVDSGHITPSHFFKETFERKNITELIEIKREKAKSFDITKNIVEW